jgi:hypothetical protein
LQSARRCCLLLSNRRSPGSRAERPRDPPLGAVLTSVDPP